MNSTQDPNLHFELSPLERVLAYLREHRPELQKRAGQRLPALRKIAKKLDVSPATVRNGFQVLVQEGLLESSQGRGCFWTSSAEKTNTREKMVIGVNINTHLQKRTLRHWSYRLYGGILHASLESDIPQQLRQVQIVKNHRLIEDEILLEKELSGLDGFILTPCYTSREIHEALSLRGIPHVSLNQLSLTQTKDFVMPGYLQACYTAGQAFRTVGRRRPLLFLAPGTEVSTASQAQLVGFLSGLYETEASCDMEFRKLTSPSADQATAFTVLEEFLDRGWIPDAVYAAGDDMALAVLHVAAKRGISIPEEMSVIGGNGLSLAEPDAWKPLTAMVHPVEQIGEELIYMLDRIRKNRDLEIAGRILPMRASLGKTTLPAENEILQRAFDSPQTAP